MTITDNSTEFLQWEYKILLWADYDFAALRINVIYATLELLPAIWSTPNTVNVSQNCFSIHQKNIAFIFTECTHLPTRQISKFIFFFHSGLTSLLLSAIIIENPDWLQLWSSLKMPKHRWIFTKISVRLWNYLNITKNLWKLLFQLSTSLKRSEYLCWRSVCASSFVFSMKKAEKIKVPFRKNPKIKKTIHNYKIKNNSGKKP